MGIEKLNEYRIDYEDNTSQIFMAKNSRSALNALETDSRAVVALNRLKVGVGVETPIRNVKFSTAVVPEGALVNKCLALPEAWIVPEETKVIFTALPADGWQFDGWFAYDGITELSKDLVAELIVNYPVDMASLSEVFEAHFSPIPAP